MAQAAWINDKPLEVLEQVEEDNAWVKLLPERSVITATKGHGASYWSRTARIDVRLPSGEDRAYFLKLATPNGGLMMCHGEYESMSALYAVSPDFIPKPIGYGTFKSDSEQHFFLSEFIDLDDDLPHVVDFCAKLADLHRRSSTMAAELKNAEQKFGFHVVTCNGTVPTHQTWEESWEAFYIDNMKHLFAWEEKLQGPSETLEEMLPILYEKVIPRLLRPLETEGRTLNPCLLHGDLWDGNTAVHAKTDAPYIFDASSFWGHNECELAKWRGSRYRMRRMYVKEYFKHIPISPPEEDWDDRNMLYSLRADLHDSILFPTTPRFRELLIVTLKHLTEKFAEGYKGPASQKGCEKPVHEAALADQKEPATVNGESVVEPDLEGWGDIPAADGPPRAKPMVGVRFDGEDKQATAAQEGDSVRHSVGELLGRENIEPNNEMTKNSNENPRHEDEYGMEYHQLSAENRSDIGVGESAISPPGGSVAGA